MMRPSTAKALKDKQSSKEKDIPKSKESSSKNFDDDLMIKSLEIGGRNNLTSENRDQASNALPRYKSINKETHESQPTEQIKQKSKKDSEPLSLSARGYTADMTLKVAPVKSLNLNSGAKK